MLVPVLFLIAGFVALYFGADWLVRGSVGLGLRLGVSPLIAGLTIVAIGTSAPELVVSLMAATSGRTDMALGNIVGSNIFNIGLILGLTALITPLRVRSQLIKLDIPILIGVTALFLFFFRDGRITRPEAGVLTFLMFAYIGLNIAIVRYGAALRLKIEFEEEITPPTGPVWQDVAFTLLGVLLLIVGSKFFVDGASEIARALGVSDAVIGLTVVAAGTSLPELAASLSAALKKHADVAVGNIVGSGIFNLVAIIGLSGLLAGPLTATGISLVDLACMGGLTLLLVLFGRTSFTLSRFEGMVLLLLFLGYQIHLWPK